MPPKKRPRLSSRAASSTPQVDAVAQSEHTPSSIESAPKHESEYDVVTDPWTDEQEMALLKSIIKWKPVGMHKHFRMIAIAEHMKNQGYAPSSVQHTRIPGIWKKLDTLYNLAALDEREDSLATDASDEPETPRDLYCPFELPSVEYSDLMFERRLAMGGSESPTASGRADSRRPSTIADTDEPRSSPVPSRGRQRGRPKRATRSSKLNVELDEAKNAPSTGEEEEAESDAAAANEDEDEDEGTEQDKEESGEEGDGEDGDEDGDEHDGDGDGDGGGIGDGEVEAEAEASPTPRSTRAQTSRSKQKDKTNTGTAPRRGGRRR